MRIKPIRATVEPSIAPTIRAPLGVTSGFARGLGAGGAGRGRGWAGVSGNRIEEEIFLTTLFP